MTSSKQSTKSSFYDVCFTISIFAMMGILLALPYQNNRLISFGTYAIAGCAVIMCARYFIEHLQYVPSEEIAFWGLAVICVISVLVARAVSFASIVSVICFLEIPMFMLCAKETMTKKPAIIFLWVQYILSFYYIYLSRTDKANYYIGFYGTSTIDELTLGYRNPNETAMYLFTCFLSLLIAFLFYKRFILRLMFGINAVMIFRLVWLTESRAGIVSCILVIIAIFLIKWVPVGKFVTKIAIAVPWVMVAAIYFFNDALVDIHFLGSSVETGRINVFDQVFKNINFFKFLFGDFLRHTFDNLHNVYISIFGTIGIFGVLLYSSYLSNSLLSQSNRTIHNISEKMAYVGILLFVIYSSVEATFFVGGSAFAMCFIGVYSFFIMQNNASNLSGI